VPGPSPDEPDRPASRAEVNSPSQTTSSIHYTRANVSIELCVCRSGGPQDALANDLGEHGDSGLARGARVMRHAAAESGIRSTMKRSLP
jgi:hypothetical protein